MKNIFDQMASNGKSNGDSSAKIEPEVPVREESRGCGDATVHTSRDIKTAVQELLKQGYLEEETRQDLFRHVIVHEVAVNAILEPLDLLLRIDTHRGIAFLAVAQESTSDSADEEGWSHPLVRRQRLTLEQSLLIAILRQLFVMHEQESGVGQGPAKIAVDDLLPQYLTYFADSGSDGKNETRLLILLEQLKTYGIVSEVDKQHEVTIRPLIAHLASPKSVQALLNGLKQQVADCASTEGGA